MHKMLTKTVLAAAATLIAGQFAGQGTAVAGGLPVVGGLVDLPSLPVAGLPTDLPIGGILPAGK